MVDPLIDCQPLFALGWPPSETSGISGDGPQAIARTSLPSHDFSVTSTPDQALHSDIPNTQQGSRLRQSPDSACWSHRIGVHESFPKPTEIPWARLDTSAPQSGQSLPAPTAIQPDHTSTLRVDSGSYNAWLRRDTRDPNATQPLLTYAVYDFAYRPSVLIHGKAESFEELASCHDGLFGSAKSIEDAARAGKGIRLDWCISRTPSAFIEVDAVDKRPSSRQTPREAIALAVQRHVSLPRYVEIDGEHGSVSECGFPQQSLHAQGGPLTGVAADRSHVGSISVFHQGTDSSGKSKRAIFSDTVQASELFGSGAKSFKSPQDDRKTLIMGEKMPQSGIFRESSRALLIRGPVTLTSEDVAACMGAAESRPEISVLPYVWEMIPPRLANLERLKRNSPTSILITDVPTGSRTLSAAVVERYTRTAKR